jgi:hypothetical protein
MPKAYPDKLPLAGAGLIAPRGRIPATQGRLFSKSFS